ncbi:hypothetical protein JYK22_18205, partial [Nonomuraea sp. RK-328]|nr:hypothetical protein [Nonomuraea sp. RK-328]
MDDWRGDFMEAMEAYGRALLVSSDAKGYGGGDDKRHEAIQAAFVQVQERAAREAGLGRGAWGIQPAGDGELAVLPSGEHEPTVVDAYVRCLDRALAEHNRGLPPEERVRLRVAIHYGVAYPAANGLAGQAVVEVSRLVNWKPLKKVLDVKDGANLVLILSDRVYRETVLQRHTSYKAEEFVQVCVQEKEFVGNAWIWVPGGHHVGLDFLRSPQSDAPRAAPAIRQQADVINNLHGPVDARQAVFGISRERA